MAISKHIMYAGRDMTPLERNRNTGFSQLPELIKWLPRAYGLIATLMLGLVSIAAHADPSALNVVVAFKKAGLEAESPTFMGPKNYGWAPYLCKGVHFLVPSLGEEAGGRAFVCSTHADRNTLASYYKKLSKTSAILFSWVFEHDNIIVQINGDLDEIEAQKYNKTLREIKSVPLRVMASNLVGTWSETVMNSDGEPATITVKLKADNTFEGQAEVNGKTMWTYAGKWNLRGSQLTWAYTNSSNRLPEPDSDEVVFVDEGALVFLPSRDKKMNVYLRRKD